MNPPVESISRGLAPPAAKVDGQFSPLCQRCDYPLVGLNGPRCPECGRAFDPRNRATYALISRRKRQARSAGKLARRILWGMLIAMTIGAGILVMLRVVLSLGYFLQYGIGLWLTHLVIAGSLTWPLIIVGRDRARWRWWELDAFVVPFCVLLYCITMNHRLGGSSNIISMVAISLAIPLGALTRVKIGNRMNRLMVSTVLLIALCCVAAGVYTMLPMGSWN